jgi:2-(1,2-epoxy-1,2-dihydrophenyl)acetyl-CoA isomerase
MEQVSDMPSDQAYQPVVVSGEAVQTIRLNRPARLNTFTSELAARLTEAVRNADRDQACRAIILTGTGRAFCAGIDLEDLQAQGIDDLGRLIESTYNPMMEALDACTKPIVGAVNGVAAGGGCALALACDIVVAAESAQFVAAFGQLGLLPDCGGTASFPRTMGLSAAMAFTLFDERLPAAVAAQRGVIWKVAPDGEFAAEIERVEAKLAAGAPAAMTATKHAFRERLKRDWSDQLKLESTMQGALGRTKNHAEGLAAFLEKRKPRFD